MHGSLRLAVSYAIFALIAMGANISAQDLTTYVYSGRYAIAIAVVLGTGTGLVVKYMLDKRFIFRFHARDVQHDGQVFILYCLTGVLTTLLFWGCEFAFHQAFETKPMRYVGAVIGLTVGYVIKYRLDRAYVFRSHSCARSEKREFQ